MPSQYRTAAPAGPASRRPVRSGAWISGSAGVSSFSFPNGSGVEYSSGVSGDAVGAVAYPSRRWEIRSASPVNGRSGSAGS